MWSRHVFILSSWNLTHARTWMDLDIRAGLADTFVLVNMFICISASRWSCIVGVLKHVSWAPPPPPADPSMECFRTFHWRLWLRGWNRSAPIHCSFSHWPWHKKTSPINALIYSFLWTVRPSPGHGFPEGNEPWNISLFGRNLHESAKQKVPNGRLNGCGVVPWAVRAGRWQMRWCACARYQKSCMGDNIRSRALCWECWSPRTSGRDLVTSRDLWLNWEWGTGPLPDRPDVHFAIALVTGQSDLFPPVHCPWDTPGAHQTPL